MKKLTTTQKQLKEKEPKHSLKRKKFCKFTKGEHQFVLVIPKYLKSFEKYKDMSLEEFYKEYNNNKSSRIFGNYNMFNYKCILCGKEKTEHELKSYPQVHDNEF